jgi:hypothetical protein
LKFLFEMRSEMGFSLSFQVETVKFTKTINSGNGNFVDRDLMSFVIKNGDEQPTIKDATELGNGIVDGQTIQLDPSWNSGVFQVTSGIPISAMVNITCQSGQSAADAKALHDKGLAEALDQLSVAVGVEGVIFGATGTPVGLALGIICAAISGVLQLAKDCIGDGPSPRSGLVFSGGLSYTVEAIQTQTKKSDGVGAYWQTTVPFTNNDGSSVCSVTFKVYVFYEQDPIFPPMGGPGKITPRIGAGPSEWAGVWGDNTSQDLAKIVCEIDQGVVPAAPGVGPRTWLYLASPEAAYRTAMAPAAFQLGGKRPAWQFSLNAFVPANPEAVSCLASSLSVKEGTAPGKSDLVLAKEDSPWSVPMLATKYAGPIFPGPKVTEAATTFARNVATASVQTSGAAVAGSAVPQRAVVGKSPTQVGPSPTQVGVTQPTPGPPPAGMGQNAPAIEFADTICLPGNVFLQLYIVYNIAAPAKRWANRIRYLRLDSKGGTITDVLLDHTAPPLT